MGRLAMLVAVVVAAGCGGSTASHVAHEDGWLAFSGCMRSSGVPRFPDPDGSGRSPKKTLQQLGVSSSRFQAAQSACRNLLPNGGQPPDQAQRQEITAQALLFSRCVRAHGVAHFPDPAGDGRIPDPASLGIDQASPAFRAANEACRKHRPPYIPSNAAYDSWAGTRG
jgi:hypothetical protein